MTSVAPAIGAPNTSAASGFDPFGTVNERPAICTAMPDEAAFFTALASRQSAPLRVGMAAFQAITFADAEVLLVTSGIGLVNAAAAATLAITRFGANLLISAGSAGGMGAGVRVGDVVIGNETAYTFADATAFGRYVKGQVPQMPATYQASPDLVRAALAATEDGLQAYVGLLISSDAFITANNFTGIVQDFPTAQAADMETAALAQVAYSFDKPWVAVRGISDLCGPVAADDFVTHLADVAALSARVVHRVIRNLAVGN